MIIIDNDLVYYGINQQYMKALKPTKQLPGIKADLPQYILKQLSQLHPRLKKSVSFFGGHPASITRASTNKIFSQLNANGQSPYLVCEKTDGTRYILVLAFVEDKDYISVNHSQIAVEDRKIQCYLVSRQGQRNLVSYVTNMKVGVHWKIPKNSDYRHTIAILDGEMIEDEINGEENLRYLVFDALVNLGVKIIDKDLNYRLRCIKKFIQYNNQLLIFDQNKTKDGVQLIMKDFFRLTLPRYNTTLFMIQKYVKMLPHQNDGLIFNNEQKDYVIGTTNNGYIKWKPAQLNTLDFMIVPNLNLSEKYGNRILDLYLGVQHPQIPGQYSRIFYNFTITSQSEFSRLNNIYEKRKEQIFEKMHNQSQIVDSNEFAGALIAECRYQITNINQRSIFSSLLNVKIPPYEIRSEIMKPSDEEKELDVILNLQKSLYDKCWKIYKIRMDKALPNNVEVARRIQESIRDGITKEELIKKNAELNELKYKFLKGQL